MVCSRCGRPIAPGATTCGACGAPGVAPLRSPGGWPVPPPTAGAAQAPAYAGFWLRFLAYVIDALVLGLVSAFASAFLGAVAGGVLGITGTAPDAIAAVGSLIGMLVGLLVYWLYFSIMESSGKQGTLGKMALGLAVTDGAGRPIGFGRASGRYFAKIVSAIPLGIGFLMAGFTGRKQALHDMIAGTLVVRRRESGVAVVVAAVAAVGVAVIFGVGILAAIAIPNFIRYQLRAKAAEATAGLTGLHAAELAHFGEKRAFVALELPAGGRPGAAKMAWTPEDLAAASALGWVVEGRSYFTYRVDVAATVDGRQAFAACAESDLDGDGTYAAVVLWQPVLDEAGKVVALPPAPPCAHAPALARSPLFELRDPVGKPVKVSPDEVF